MIAECLLHAPLIQSIQSLAVDVRLDCRQKLNLYWSCALILEVVNEQIWTPFTSTISSTPIFANVINLEWHYLSMIKCESAHAKCITWCSSCEWQTHSSERCSRRSKIKRAENVLLLVLDTPNRRWRQSTMSSKTKLKLWCKMLTKALDPKKWIPLSRAAMVSSILRFQHLRQCQRRRFCHRLSFKRQYLSI